MRWKTLLLGQFQFRWCILGTMVFFNICYCCPLELQILPWARDFLKQCRAVCPSLQTCDQVCTSIFTGMATPNWWHVCVIITMALKIFFFPDGTGKMMLFKLSGVRKVIQYREGNERRITKETHKEKRQEEWDTYKKADRKVTETKDRCRSCLKGSRVSHWVIVTVTIRFS